MYNRPVARLGNEERQTFALVRRACAAHSDSIGLREDVSKHLMRYLRAYAFCAMEIDPVTTLPVHDVNHGWPPEYVLPLVEKALFSSRTADTGFLTRHCRRALILDELLGSDSPKQDPYFQYHVLPFGYRHEIQFMCISGGLPRALFTFNRRSERGAFAARHLRLLEAVAPHVGAAMHAACVRSALAERPATETGFILLGPEGAVELTNRVGASLLSRRASQAPLLGLDVFLGLMRRSLREGAPPPISTMSLTDPATRSSYRLIGEPSIASDGRPRTMVLLEPARAIDSQVGLLRLGLTAREALVVTEVLRDESVAACAERLACAPATVTRHLKNVFAKLEVGSRRELALRLLGNPPNVVASPRALP